MGYFYGQCQGICRSSGINFQGETFHYQQKNFCSRLRQHSEDRIVNLQITGDLNLIIGWEKGIIKFEN